MAWQKGFFLFSIFAYILSTAPTYAEPDKSLVFEQKNIKIGGKLILVAIADNHAKRQQGLMNRSSWGKWQGMLFIFEDQAVRSFWMKDTRLPLSIGFFNKDKVLKEVYDLNPPKSLFQKEVDRVFSKSLARYALEVPRHWFKNNGIKSGEKFSFSE